MIKVSIVVPIYNVEQYLRKCVESLINQTLQEIEIILVDDASLDHSRQIMIEYERKYPQKIKCLYLENNLSQGGARNKGLEIALGQFVTFVDSDDYIDRTMCEKLYTEALKTNSDVVFCDMLREFEGREDSRQSSLVYNQQMGKITEEKRSQLFLLESYPVAKIVKREIIVENGLWFPEHIKYEDRSTINLYFIYCESCAYVKEALYHYLCHEGSTTTENNGKQNLAYMKASFILANRMKKKGMYGKYHDAIDMIMIKGYLYGIGMGQAWKNPDLEQIYLIIQEMKERFPTYNKNPFYDLDYGIEAFQGKWILSLSDCTFAGFKKKYKKGMLSLKCANYEEYYSVHYEKVVMLLRYLKKKEKKIALWGAGKKGKDFLKVCDDEGEYVSSVIDRDEKKWGTRLETGHIISDFRKEEIDCIVVVNYAFFFFFYTKVKQQNDIACLVNLDAYISMGSGENIEDFLE